MEAKYTGPERRRFLRLQEAIDVVYKKHLVTDKEKVLLTKNIGAGGICLRVYGDELSEGDMLDLKIYLPEPDGIITAVGKVVWRKEIYTNDVSQTKRLDVGIEFTEIRPQDRKRINKYVL
jgi:c-di-GMP-binding flagellar brake protein YcgR